MIRRSQGFLSQIYAMVDFLCIELAYLFSWWIKFQSGWLPYAISLSFQTYMFYGVVYGITAIGVGYFIGFYSPKRKKQFSFEVYKIIQIHSINLLIFLSILFVVKEVHISRSFLFIFMVCLTIMGSIYRYFIKITLKYFREKGFNKQFILILGAGQIGRRFYNSLQQYPEIGMEVIGFLDDVNYNDDIRFKKYKPILGKIDDLEKVLNEKIVDEVIIALPLEVHHKYGAIINICEKIGVKTQIIPDFFDILPAKPYFDNFAGIPIINVRDIPLDELRNRFIKRIFDIVFSIFVIFITLPLLVIITIGIKLTSKGPVIFKQERLGLNRREFVMYKFRTMVLADKSDSDKLWTTPNDSRKTKFGAFLRKTSLDELPQFINVLKGDMSVVGPRPERPYFTEKFKEEVPSYMVKHHIRPGITGWAQSNGYRGDTSIEERIKYDLFYIENWSFVLDVKIIIKTIFRGFSNKNAY